MADLLVYRGKHRSVIIATSPNGKLNLLMDFDDVMLDKQNRPFIYRNNEAANEIIKEYKESRGIDIDVK